jgi:hypothetical protein
MEKMGCVNGKKILKKTENLFVWNEFFFTFALPIKGMAA